MCLELVLETSGPTKDFVLATSGLTDGFELMLETSGPTEGFEVVLATSGPTKYYCSRAYFFGDATRQEVPERLLGFCRAY